jgi:hypothetical protein
MQVEKMIDEIIEARAEDAVGAGGVATHGGAGWR